MLNWFIVWSFEISDCRDKVEKLKYMWVYWEKNQNYIQLCLLETTPLLNKYDCNGVSLSEDKIP